MKKSADVSAKQFGLFTVGSGQFHGELLLSGEESSLYLHGAEEFDPRISEECVHGVLHDLTKVSLFKCMSRRGGHSSGANGTYYYAEIFPHFATVGDFHLSPDEKVITDRIRS